MKASQNQMITILALCLLIAQPVSAASKQEIDIKVTAAIERFQNEVEGGNTFLQRAKGVLIFPEVIKAGLGIGGEYGEGALRVGGSTVDYYSTAATSIGLQFGAQMKTVILVFLDSEALEKFRNIPFIA